MLIHSVEDVIEKMRDLKLLGVSFALDDFGMGYSSLHLLKRLPLDQIKIDRSFVRQVLTEPNDAAIANMIVALGTTLGLEVLAEGIETIEQRDFLINAGCYRFQGYLFSRPLITARFEEFAGLHGTAALLHTAAA
jgi:EAL domain-containing protein (putative c-di-GMP-specific phosphodiesterase class I)